MTIQCRVVAVLLAALISLVLAGCSSISHKPSVSAVTSLEEVRNIAIFFDGTANDDGSDTNIKRLHSLVTLQDRNDIAALYIQGVGTDFDAIGAATGSGINRRAQIAYEFIQNNYRLKGPGLPPDKIYIFGFSRGAYTARILASMLYHAGLPYSGDRTKCRLTTDEVAEAVHTAVAPLEASYIRIDERERRQNTQDKLAEFNTHPTSLPAAHGCFTTPSAPVEVDVLGIWDTVEALGFANWPSRIANRFALSQHTENVDVPNTRYGDKLCNVRHAFHAVSIDDNRAWIFTPLLLTRPHQFSGCEVDKDGRVAPLIPMLTGGKLDGDLIEDRLKEVWFSGAHSDVGGGYGGSALSGVSLNWMIKQLNEVASNFPSSGLLPAGARVREDRFGTSHNPSTGLFDLTYHNIHRDLYRYMQQPASTGITNPAFAKEVSPVDAFKGRLCVHPSVFERRIRLPLQPYENPQLMLKDDKVAYLTDVLIEPDLPWKKYVQVDRITTTTLQVDSYPNCAKMKKRP